MLNGEIDFILKCVAPDLSSFQRFLTEELTSAPNVASVKTSLVIRCAKDQPGVPFDVLEAAGELGVGAAKRFFGIDLGNHIITGLYTRNRNDAETLSYATGWASNTRNLNTDVFQATIGSNFRTTPLVLQYLGPSVLNANSINDVRITEVVTAPIPRTGDTHNVTFFDFTNKRLVTEPLSPAQLASIGWARRQGLTDITNQFHYYRLTADNRILWGGYDAIYYWRSKTSVELESRPETWAVLAEHFFQTFPQLEDLDFSNAWGGAIDTSTRFSVFFGTAMQNRVAYAVGYTGLGDTLVMLGLRYDTVEARAFATRIAEFMRDTAYK